MELVLALDILLKNIGSCIDLCGKGSNNPDKCSYCFWLSNGRMAIHKMGLEFREKLWVALENFVECHHCLIDQVNFLTAIK